MSSVELDVVGGDLDADLAGDVAGLLGDRVAVLVVVGHHDDVAAELGAGDHRLGLGELERHAVAGPGQLVDGERRPGGRAVGPARLTIRNTEVPGLSLSLALGSTVIMPVTRWLGSIGRSGSGAAQAELGDVGAAAAVRVVAVAAHVDPGVRVLAVAAHVEAGVRVVAARRPCRGRRAGWPVAGHAGRRREVRDGLVGLAGAAADRCPLARSATRCAGGRPSWLFLLQPAAASDADRRGPDRASHGR